MNNIFGFLEKTLMNPMTKVANTKYIKAIMNAGMASVPFTIVGSMFLILNSIPTSFPQTQTFFENTVFRFSGLTSAVTSMSLGAIALYFAMSVAYYLTKEYQQDNVPDLDPLNGAFLALFGFLITLVQLTITKGNYVAVNDIVDGVANVASGIAFQHGGIQRIGGSGVFVGILVATLTTEIYRFCISKNITIKMPDMVPPGVSRSFAALIPAFFVSIVIIFFQGILVFFNTDIHLILSAPFAFLSQMMSSWLGLMVVIVVTIALWAVGIHGSAIVSNIISPLLLVNMTENAEAIASGQQATNVIAGEFLNSYVWIGGSGGTLGLVFVLAFLAKAPQLKVIGRTSIIPGFFNINEPIIFGVPLVYNPFLLIPFFLAPMVSGTIAYFLTSIGFAGHLYAAIPWTSPIGIGAFTSSGGSIGALLTALICCLASVIIWYPFVHLYDKKLVNEMNETV